MSSEPALIVAPLKPSWLDSVCDIERLCYPSPWSRQALQHALDGGYPNVGCWQAPRRLLGYIIYERIGEEVNILNVAVHPEARRRGAGRAMLERLHAQERQAGAKQVHLEVSRGNQAALKLYEGFGYRQVGTRKAYYRDTREDALLMTCNLC